MSIRLGNELFPDSVLTDPWPGVDKLFVERARTISLKDRTAKELIADWTADLSARRNRREARRRRKARLGAQLGGLA